MASEDRVGESVGHRVWVDFNSGFDRRDANRRYFRQPSLETVGSRRDLARLGLEPIEGLSLLVYMEDTDVDGRPGALVASGMVVAGPHGWLVDIADDEIERFNGD